MTWVAPFAGAFVGLLVGARLYGGRCVLENIDPTCYPGSNLRILLSAAVGFGIGAAWFIVRMARGRHPVMRWWLPVLGAFAGVAVAYLLPEYRFPGPTDGPMAPRTYFFWDTLSRNWAAVFYGMVGLGAGVVAAIVLRPMRHFAPR
jgi:hypothetical protein